MTNVINGSFTISFTYNCKPPIELSAAVVAIPAAGGVILIPSNIEATKNNVPAKMAQITNCNTPAKDVPMIFPIINWNGFTDEIIISMILFVFSSITLRMTMLP
ncbi:hypothetical protein D3C80_1713870 [compost metagenome]